MNKPLLLTCLLMVLVQQSVHASANKSLPTNKAFIYTKSNFDGSRAGKIAVFYRKPYEIESFKWRSGNDSGTVVKAVIDPLTHNVKSFLAYRLRADGTKIPGAELMQLNQSEIHAKFGEHTSSLIIENLKWHSYDFDFASLAYAYRLLENKLQGISFTIIDLDLNADSPRLKVFGEVDMSYNKTITVNGKSLLEYNIDGEGLNNRGGQIWFNEHTHEMDGFKIKKPDESNYNSNLLKLETHIELNEQQWQQFKSQQLNSP